MGWLIALTVFNSVAVVFLWLTKCGHRRTWHHAASGAGIGKCEVCGRVRVSSPPSAIGGPS